MKKILLFFLSVGLLCNPLLGMKRKREEDDTDKRPTKKRKIAKTLNDLSPDNLYEIMTYGQTPARRSNMLPIARNFAQFSLVSRSFYNAIQSNGTLQSFLAYCKKHNIKQIHTNTLFLLHLAIEKKELLRNLFTLTLGRNLLDQANCMYSLQPIRLSVGNNANIFIKSHFHCANHFAHQREKLFNQVPNQQSVILHLFSNRTMVFAPPMLTPTSIVASFTVTNNFFQAIRKLAEQIKTMKPFFPFNKYHSSDFDDLREQLSIFTTPSSSTNTKLSLKTASLLIDLQKLYLTLRKFSLQNLFTAFLFAQNALKNDNAAQILHQKVNLLLKSLPKDKIKNFIFQFAKYGGLEYIKNLPVTTKQETARILAIALQHNQQEIVDHLTTTFESPGMALQLAAQAIPTAGDFGYLESVKQLFENFKLLDQALLTDPHFVRKLLKHTTKTITLAAKRGHFKIIRYIYLALKKKNLANEINRQCLLIAFHEVVARDDYEAMKFLVTNCQNKIFENHDTTPLISAFRTALQNGCPNALQYLVEKFDAIRNIFITEQIIPNFAELFQNRPFTAHHAQTQQLLFSLFPNQISPQNVLMIFQLAAQNNRQSLVKFLCENEPFYNTLTNQIQMIDNELRTLSQNQSRNNLQLMLYLLKKFPNKVGIQAIFTTLDTCIRIQNLEAVIQLTKQYHKTIASNLPAFAITLFYVIEQNTTNIFTYLVNTFDLQPEIFPESMLFPAIDHAQKNQNFTIGAFLMRHPKLKNIATFFEQINKHKK